MTRVLSVVIIPHHSHRYLESHHVVVAILVQAVPKQRSNPSFCLQGCRPALERQRPRAKARQRLVQRLVGRSAASASPLSKTHSLHRKTPAAAPAESQKSHEEEDVGEGPREESEAADAGENDDSPPTRGQRYVFNRDFDTLPQSVQDEYTRIKKSRVFGKQQLLNKLINRAVRNRAGGYKAKVDTSSATGITNIIYG